jgi:transposase-like protein
MDLPREDLLPEYYRDEGCELAPSCLDCPFPCCVEDMPRGRQHRRKEIRNREILRLFYTQGEDIKQIAQRLRVSKRTVQRALKEVMWR